MKQGKNPTVAQKRLIMAAGLNCRNWLVSKHTPELLLIVNRVSRKTRVIMIGGRL